MKREVLIALFAAITLALTIWGYKFISGKNLFSANYTYYAYYDNVHEVNTATPVQINGYEVGTVISIAPDPDDISRMRLEFTVKNSIKLPKNTVAKLMPASPLGGKIVELDFDKMCDGSNCAEDKSVLEGETIGILGALISEEELQSKSKLLTTVVDSALGQLGSEDSQDAVDVSIRNLAISLQNFAELSGKFNDLMANSSRNMEKTFANLDELTETLIVSNEKINAMLDDLTVVTEDLKEVKLSETLDTANGTLTQAEQSLKTMDTTMNEMKDLLQKISNGEGSMGKLMQDEQLYENLESTTKNLDLLIQDIRLNPRRYFRLFGKKSKDYEYPDNDPADLGEGN